MTLIARKKIYYPLFIVVLIVGVCRMPSYAQSGSTPNKLELLIFSGSDWCIPCIKFERDVRQDPAFVKFSETYLDVLVADFPQHKKLDKSLIQRNEQLAEKYNPQGVFPLVLLLNSQRNVIANIRTNKVTAEDVINQIRVYLSTSHLKEFNQSAVLMGSAFHFTLVTDAARGERLLKDCIHKVEEIESWLSAWKTGSITTTLNTEAAENPVKVTPEYYQLMERCIGISNLTQGAFDISFNGVGALYSFDKKEHNLPSDEEIKRAIQHVGYKQIDLLQDERISFKDSLLKIGFGAIGKGYAAEQVKQLMIKNGVLGGVINASGDLTTWGRRATGEAWQVGIPDPEKRNEILLWLPLEDKAIATSGDYEKYFMHNGIQYSHIINPKTGRPVVGSRSVSVISSSAELSDALATAVSVLGVDVGIDLINQLDGVECVFIDNNRKLHFSTGLETYEN